MAELRAAYANVDAERLWDNLAYFLKAVIPVAERAGVRLGDALGRGVLVYQGMTPQVPQAVIVHESYSPNRIKPGTIRK